MDEPTLEQPAEPTPPRPTYALTANLKDTVAAQYVMGMGPSEIAYFHQRPVEKIARLLQTKEMQDLIAAKRSYFLEAGSRVMFKFLLSAEELAQGQLDCARVPGPDQFKARTWILERIVPNRTISQVQAQVEHTVHHEVMIGLKTAMQEVGQVLNIGVAAKAGGESASPPTTQAGIQLLNGVDAMPDLDPEDGDE